MKKFYLLSILFFGLFNGFSQTPVTLTFQAKDSLTQNALALDSINVKNLTENCDTTLYDSVPVLNLNALWPVGIGEPTLQGSESFIVIQNAPNPFRGTTQVRIFLKKEGELNLAVYNNQGKTLSQCRNRFEKGWHLFAISSSGSRLLFLKVSDNTSAKTIKIISAGPGSEYDRISYKGTSGQGNDLLKSVSDSTGFIFYLGNQIQYTVYIHGYYDRILLDNPVSTETYTFAMLAPFPCGSSFTINHLAGAVAPVDKTVTYGTVNGIPGEPTKCWITSNHGADHQATAVNDATEPSAGWYWQFNHKQGYKHDGTTRTPNTAWNYMPGNSNWTVANDPCTLELGSGWRIPTLTEWDNVSFTGDWLTNLNGPWNSALKMHTAGDLLADNGTLEFRGTIGVYWSSSQWDADWANLLYFDNSVSMIVQGPKASGVPIRCIREDITLTITTAIITGITQTTATGGGEVINSGGNQVTARGVLEYISKSNNYRKPYLGWQRNWRICEQS